ncbi:MAG TPA: hypothetical protein VE270_05155 [Thermoleophilaceae bacterium]|nr:hypothetical protein [Thermoleophilaceae bacterium]
MTEAPVVELLWWEGCPSHPEALVELERVLEEEGLRAEVELVEIESDEQAARQRFPGSPTIRIDGEDILPPGEGEPFSLNCRVYRLRDGRPSPTPDPEDVRVAVRRAKEDL